MTRPLRVFLCHASQDKPAVRKLHRYLKQHGIEPWLDQEDLLPGENWEVEIPRALNASDVILVCLSKNSVNKEGYVQKEISFALDKALEKPDGTIFIIPAKLEECDVPKRLNRFQWVDLFRPDSNKRLLLGLNKRALDLGSDVSPVILEDTRQRKPSATKSVADSAQLDRDAAEKAEKAAQAKLEQEAAERAEIARLAQEAKERLEREEAEKVARAKLEKEAAEQAEAARVAKETKERSEHEAADAARIAREKTEREEKEKLERETAEQAKAQLPVGRVSNPTITRGEEIGQAASLTYKVKPPKQENRKILLGGAGLLLFAILAFAAWKMSQLPASPEVTQIPSVTNTLFVAPPTLTKTPIPATSTATTVPTPTLGIGSTMIGEKGETLVYVPEGEFTMGDGASNAPIHTVYLDAFWIDQTEVTNKQYKACVDAGTCEPPSDTSSYKHPNYYGNPEFDNYPVLYVNWDKANRYCEVWAGGDLSTEAQWEKAARGTDARTYPWGEDISCDKANYYSGSYCVGDTTEVGAYPSGASIYGAYDMAGNVWEWVNDWYGETYYQDSSSSNNPAGPESGQDRVLRGGSWDYLVSSVRSALRAGLDPTVAGISFGFRCSRSP